MSEAVCPRDYFQNLALFLHLDGTLVGFWSDPDKVTESPELQALLQHLYQLTGGAAALLADR